MFTSLKELSIHANIFDEPLGLEKLVKMESLERLEMLNVNYKDFPEQLCNLQNLKYLKIRGCDFKFIPDSIVRFKNLSNLSIENTDIITLPVVMKNMPGIKELSLRANWSLKISCNELPLNLEKLYISESIFGKEILEESQLLMPRLRVFYS
ncbi:hypothetical protein [uncultured Flavobacterium sp.]|uniref:leucine-rich repeat domain-containing protein n=1 Tax=uncultured Flavobacterium sp. TaxID=165435 RepID=UPI0025F3219A|nr:hypothetical protein [uncultured Flavobacterium sp.]